MENINKNLIFTILTVVFLSFFVESLMLIIYYPAPIAPFNIPKIVYTLIYYISLFLFGLLLAQLSRYGKAFVWIFGVFIIASLGFAYIFSNLSYLFMGNNLGAQLGEFKKLMPKIIPLTIFVNISILIFGYSIAFIFHSIYGKYTVNNSKSVGSKTIFIISIVILALALAIFIPAIYNINDIGSYWKKVTYSITLDHLKDYSQLTVRVKNNLNANIEIVNMYIPIYTNGSESKSLGMDDFGSQKIIKPDKEYDFKIKIDQKNIKIGSSYIKFLYKGKILRKDYRFK